AGTPRREGATADRPRRGSSARRRAASDRAAARAPAAARPLPRRRAAQGMLGARSRSFPRKRESRMVVRLRKNWVPAYAGTSGLRPHALPSLDDLVGAGNQRWRQREAERLRGFEIDEQLEMRGQFERQVGGARAAQDAGDETGGDFADRALLGAVRHQPAV